MIVWRGTQPVFFLQASLFTHLSHKFQLLHCGFSPSLTRANCSQPAGRSAQPERIERASNPAVVDAAVPSTRASHASAENADACGTRPGNAPGHESGAPAECRDADSPAVAPNSRRRGKQQQRAAAVDAAARFVRSAGLSPPPVAFLAADGSAARVVACPVRAEHADSLASPAAVWASIDDVATTPVYDAVAAALAHTGTFMHHGDAALALDAVLGARPLRPLAHARVPRSLAPAAWHAQLQFAEAADSLLRRALTNARDVLGASCSTELNDYLASWADQIDTAPNTMVPVGLQGQAPRFDDPRLVDAPFAHIEGAIPRMPYRPDRDTPTPQPATAYRPRSIVPGILSPEGGRIAAGAIRDNLRDLRSMLRARGGTYTRTARTRVIPQSLFHPEARGIVWDTSKVLYDDVGCYFAPVDFDAPMPTTLRTQRLYDLLGDGYDDQSLRHMALHGFVFAPSPDMNMVICKHLISLADGAARVDTEFDRLRSNGYLQYIERLDEHYAALDDDRVCLAFGRLPCICASQGTRERKLEPGRPRRIEDAGEPRKPLVGDDGTVVRDLNTQMDVHGAFADGTPKHPKERKPAPRTAMHDNAVLQSMARVWREPVYCFSDDMKDCFNQFFIHPGQTWLTTILWVDDAFRMRHILELSLGFGQRLSSNFAQRATYAIMHLFQQRVDAIEAALFDNETDPSRLEFIKRRRALAARTGRNECRLHAASIYTDDPLVQVVGAAHFVRVLAVWHELIAELGVRMAIAAKRQGGSASLWLGLQHLATLGYEIIPPAKRQRAVDALSHLVADEGMQNDEYDQLRGLLVHLQPFAEQNGAMYGMHRPAARSRGLGPAGWMPASADMLTRARAWINVLQTRSCVPTVIVVLADLHTGAAHAAAYVMSSDAAKDGTSRPGLAGHMHGSTWRIPLDAADVVGPLQISIPVLELAAIVVNVMVHGPHIPDGAPVIIMTDSLTSADALADESARVPLMQFLHATLLALPEFARIAPHALVGHCYGETNVVSDAESRGYDDVTESVCLSLRVKHVRVEPPSAAHELIAELRRRHRDSLPDAASAGAPASVPGPPTPAPHTPRDARPKRRTDPPTERPNNRARTGPHGPGQRIGEASHPGPAPKESPAPAPAAVPPEPPQRERRPEPARPRHIAGSGAPRSNNRERTEPHGAGQRVGEAANPGPTPAGIERRRPPAILIPPAAPQRARSPAASSGGRPPRPPSAAHTPTFLAHVAPARATSRFSPSAPFAAPSSRPPMPRSGSPPAWRAPSPVPLGRGPPHAAPAGAAAAVVRPKAQRASAAPHCSANRPASFPPLCPARPPSRERSPRNASPAHGGAASTRAPAQLAEVAASARTQAVLDTLRRDTSPWALRPDDPNVLAGIVNMVHGAIDGATPPRSLAQEDRKWQKWKQFCALLNTRAWREDHAALTGADRSGQEREIILQVGFVLWVYRDLKPRRRSDPAAKPASARKYLTAVRAAHLRRNVRLPDAPCVAKAMRGLLKQYVRVHGVASLLPHRKEPIENRHCRAIYELPEGTKLSATLALEWGSLATVAFVALLNMLRAAGMRKSDLLPVTPEEFDRSHVTRSHVEYIIAGRRVRDPSAALLRGLREGDRLLLRPGCSKADPLALTFGDKEIPINWHDSPLNAAKAFATLELAAPVHGEAREHTPAFTINDAGRSMSHSDADALFDRLATAALGAAVASTLSLHGGRIFMATALRAVRTADGAHKYDVPMVKACCRWKSDDSAAVYDRMQQEAHAQAIDDAFGVEEISPTLITTTRRDVVIDNDEAVRLELGYAAAGEARSRRAASPSNSPGTAAPPPTASARVGRAAPGTSAAGSDDDASGSDADDDAGDLVQAGAPVAKAELHAGLEVACPFRLDGAEVHFKGKVVRLAANHAVVAFRDRKTK